MHRGWRSRVPALSAGLGSAGRAAATVDGLALLLVALLARLAWLGRNPLFEDELFSVYWSRLSPGFLLGAGARIETNPPGYYLVLHGWMALAGSSVIAVRLPSALLSTLGVLVVYALGRQLIDRPTALLAGLVAAINPAAIMFAQQARPYALTSLLDGLVLLSIAAQARGRGAGMAAWGWRGMFVLTAIGTVLAHDTSLIFLAACAAAIGLDLATTRPIPRRQAALWGGAGLVVSLALAAPVSWALGQYRSANIAWIDMPSAQSVRVFCMDLLLRPGVTDGAAATLGGAALLLVLAAAAGRWRLDRAALGVLVLIPALFCLLLLGASLWRPMLLSRVGAWLSLPLCLLLARAVMVQRTPSRRALALAPTAIVLLLAWMDGHRALTEDWPAAARLAATDARCGGPLLLGGATGLGLIYAEPRLGERPIYRVLPTAADPGTAEFALMQRILHPRILAERDLAGFLRRHPGAVLVTRGRFARQEATTLQALLTTARVGVNLAGNLTASCF